MSLVVVLLGIVITVAVFGAVLLYLRRRLVRDPFAPGRQQRTALAVLGGLLAVVVLCIAAAELLPPAPFARLALPGFLGLALLFYVLLSLLVLELPRLALARFDRRRHPHEHEHAVDVERRRSISRILAGTAGAAATATVGFGYVRATSRVKAKAVTVPLLRADPAVDGLRIAVLSDIHLTSGLRERSWMAQTVETVNRQGVDLVAVVGDLVDGDVDELGPYARPMADLEAPLGAFFVTGNHEYISGAEQWIEFLPTLGLRVLRNERVSIERGGKAFDLAGVDDVAGARYDGGPDLPATLAGRDPERTVILLAHQPVLAEEASGHGVDLQVSGHTHGGQMWPLHYLVRLQQGHLAGLERVGRTVLYTSRGVGSWGPPVRVGAPPEISILTLRA